MTPLSPSAPSSVSRRFVRKTSQEDVLSGRLVRRTFCQDWLRRLPGRRFVRTVLCDIFFRRTSLDVLSGRHFVRTALRLIVGGSELFWVILGGYGWLRVVMGGFGWLWVVMGQYYRVFTGGYEWLWWSLVGSGWLWVIRGGYVWLWVQRKTYESKSRHLKKNTSVALSLSGV